MFAAEVDDLPKRIANDEERNIFLLRIAQNLVAVRLDHLTVRNCDCPSIILFL